MFWGSMANHLGWFSGASGPSEVWEKVGGAVGGEAQVEVVKFWLWFWTYHRLELWVKPNVLWSVKSLRCSILSHKRHTFSQLWGHFRKCFSWGIEKCESLVALNGAPKRFHRPKNIWFDSQFKSVVCSEPKSQFQMGLRLLKIVPNDLPYPKTWGLTPKSSL